MKKFLFVVLMLAASLVFYQGTVHAYGGVWDAVPGQDIAIPFFCDIDGAGENTLWAIASLSAQAVPYIVYNIHSEPVYDNTEDFTKNDIESDDCLTLAAKMSDDDRAELTVGSQYRGYIIYFGVGDNLMAWSYMMNTAKGFAAAGIVVEGEGGLDPWLCELNVFPYACSTASVIYPRYYIHNSNPDSGTNWIFFVGLNNILLSGVICNEDEDCPSGFDEYTDEVGVIKVNSQIPGSLFTDYPHSGFAILGVYGTTIPGNEAGFFGISHQKAQAETVEGTWDVTHRIHTNPDYILP